MFYILVFGMTAKPTNYILQSGIWNLFKNQLGTQVVYFVYLLILINHNISVFFSLYFLGGKEKRKRAILKFTEVEALCLSDYLVNIKTN